MYPNLTFYLIFFFFGNRRHSGRVFKQDLGLSKKKKNQKGIKKTMGNLAFREVLMNAIGCGHSEGKNSDRHNAKQERK